MKNKALLAGLTVTLVATVLLTGCASEQKSIESVQPTTEIVSENFTIYFKNNNYYVRELVDDTMVETKYPTSKTKLAEGTAAETSTLIKNGTPFVCGNILSWIVNPITEAISDDNHQSPKRCLDYSYLITLPTTQYETLTESIPASDVPGKKPLGNN